MGIYIAADNKLQFVIVSSTVFKLWYTTHSGLHLCKVFFSFCLLAPRPRWRLPRLTWAMEYHPPWPGEHMELLNPRRSLYCSELVFWYQYLATPSDHILSFFRHLFVQAECVLYRFQPSCPIGKGCNPAVTNLDCSRSINIVLNPMGWVRKGERSRQMCANATFEYPMLIYACHFADSFNVYVFLLVICGAQVRLANVSSTRTFRRPSLHDMMAVLPSAFHIRGHRPFWLTF